MSSLQSRISRNRVSRSREISEDSLGRTRDASDRRHLGTVFAHTAPSSLRTAGPCGVRWLLPFRPPGPWHCRPPLTPGRWPGGRGPASSTRPSGADDSGRCRREDCACAYCAASASRLPGVVGPQVPGHRWRILRDTAGCQGPCRF